VRGDLTATIALLAWLRARAVSPAQSTPGA
jgi:hypothetical protein